VAVAADLPAEAGLSSSAALEVAFCRAAMLAGGWRITGAAAASTCRAAEREYVGVDSGIMDQLTCALARQGAALLIDCADVTVTEVPLSDDAAWILLDTGTRRHLADGAYNERRRELESARLDAERELNRALPHPARLRESDLEKLRLPSAQERRLRHVVTETRRVTAAVTALKNDDLRTLGVLMNRSHESLRDLFEVSTPALDRLQAAAVAAGALGARMMGAGFGGSVLALSRRAEAASVGQTAAESGGASQWFIAESASGAFAV
jgi:galactokinase